MLSEAPCSLHSHISLPPSTRQAVCLRRHLSSLTPLVPSARVDAPSLLPFIPRASRLLWASRHLCSLVLLHRDGWMRSTRGHVTLFEADEEVDEETEV
ncbi:hypothetical protein DPEC_G00321110 [Dallia pectoralis]|uniref:Uncharacterized protein n=1 Tax=Dallia pectoralis TaxID=75939 RepID=A0ACC2FA15_DALPE|nr:hypothetical protein DPEC_G00321110 [Dallia pectoralis]